MDDDFSTTLIENADTLTLNLEVGDEVRCVMGDLKGILGVMTACRADGRVLIRIAQGMYVELPRFCVERVKPEVQP